MKNAQTMKTLETLITPSSEDVRDLIKRLPRTELQKVRLAIDILQEDDTISSVQELMAEVTKRSAQAN